MRVAVGQSAEVGELMTALAKAQAEMENPDFDSKNRFGKGYSSMAAVRNATIPLLAKHGIATTQHPDFCKETGTVRCVTILWYGGQYLKSTLTSPVVRMRREEDRGPSSLIPLAELTHQEYTATFSYIRRIALKAICNVADEDDEDGERDGGSRDSQGIRRQPDRERPVPRREPEKPTLSPAEERWRELLGEIHDRYRETVQPLKHAGMHKAIFFHSFHIDKPEMITQQSVETFEAGMALYRHLTGALATWDRLTKPDDWIAAQQRLLATQASAGSLPTEEIVDPATGEVLSDMPAGWLTRTEEAQLRAHNADAGLTQVKT
jgi:hypothetical protein